jgi:hypothetical protein
MVLSHGIIITSLEYNNVCRGFAKDGLQGKSRRPGVYTAAQGGFSICGKRVETGLGADADLPILAGGLVAEAGGFGETVKVALFSLPFAIDRSQSVPEAF